MAVWTNSAEGGTNGTTVTTANSGGVSGNAFGLVSIGSGAALTYSTAAAYRGSLGYAISTTSAIAVYAGTGSGLGYARSRIRYYLNLGAYPSGVIQHVQVATSGGGIFYLYLSETGQISVINAAGTAVKTFPAISLNTWYRIEFIAQPNTSTSGVLRAAIYAGDSLTAIDSYASTTADAGSGTINLVNFGKLNNAQTWATGGRIDSISIDDANSTNFIGTDTYGDAVLADAPVAWWRGNGSTNDAVTGGTAGTLTNGATYGASIVPGASTQSFSLDGTDDQVAIPHTTRMQFTTALTAEAWIVPSAAALTGYRSAFSKGDSWTMEMIDGRLGVFLPTANGVQEFTGPGVVTAGQAYHWAFTYDGANVRIYQNGVQVAIAALTGAVGYNAINASIGSWNNGSSDFFAGRIGEVALYNTVLSPTRLAAHYAAGNTTSSTHQGAGTASGNVDAVGDGTIVAGPAQGAGVASTTGNAVGDGTVIPLLQGAGTATANGNAVGDGAVIALGSTGTASTAGSASGAGTAWVTNNSGEASAAVNATGEGTFFNPRDIVLYTKLTGTFTDFAGNPIEGWVILTPGIPFQLDHVNQRIVVLHERRVPLVNGSFSAMVAGNGTPDGAIWRWTCELVRNGQPRRGSVDFVIPIGTAEIDLADCTVR